MASKLLAKVTGAPKRHQECGFKNFETTNENKKQFELCRDWDGKQSMFLTGNAGTGKTHLAIAMLKNFPMIEDNNSESQKYRKIKMENILNEGSEEDKKKMQAYLDEEIWKFRSAWCLFAPLVELFLELNEAAMNDGKLDILKEYSSNPYKSNYEFKGYDCICFDDLGAEKLTEAKRENFYYIIDTRYRELLPTIVTSNFTINEISENEPRIASRFAEMGQILQFNGSDFRKRK